MPNPNFPGPNINRVMDSSPKIVSVGMKTDTEWGARKSAMPKSIKNDMTLRHVGDKG